MAFDPDKYLEKKAKTQPSFDPDAYLASKKEPIPGEGLLRGALQALPVAGAIGGGLLSGGPSLGLLTAGGAALGGAGGKALQNILESQLLGDQKTRENIYIDPVIEGAWSGLGEGAGQAIVGSLKTGKGLLKKYVPGMEMLFKRFEEAPKPDAHLIEEASQRLGLKPTAGMLTENTLRQGMESSLAQSPTAAGQLVARDYKNIYKGLKSGSEMALKDASDDLVLSGQGARFSINETVKNELRPAVKIYEELAGDAKLIEVNPKTTDRISKNILNMDAAKFKSNPAHSTVKMIAEDMSNVNSLTQLRALKTQTFREMQAAKGEARYVLGDIYDRLLKAEKSVITRASLEAAENMKQGVEVGRQMISDIKKANKIYRGVNTKIKTLAEEMGIKGIKNHSEFARAIEAMPDEKVAEQFWKNKNNRGMEFFKQEFPEAFEYIRKSKLGDIYNRSILNGEVNVTKLISQSKKMTPQSRKLLFGDDGIQILEDLEKVKNSIPPKMGPSGTPQGQEYRDFLDIVLSPADWPKEARRGLQLWVLKNPKQASRMGVKPPKEVRGKSNLINQFITKPAARELLGPDDDEQY